MGIISFFQYFKILETHGPVFRCLPQALTIMCPSPVLLPLPGTLSRLFRKIEVSGYGHRLCDEVGALKSELLYQANCLNMLA